VSGEQSRESTKPIIRGTQGVVLCERKDRQMYQVNTNKYSHHGSGFSYVASEHAYEADAKAAADKLWKSGHRRFVYVTKDHRETVYNPAKK
jgi:DNA-binding LacI/PurR family transcriptional regulator